jgi:predicted DNA-binding transcriptional regulator AlpA
MWTYIWARPFKICEYYLVGATLPFATLVEAEKALFEVVRAGRIRAKLCDVEVHPTHLEPFLRIYLEQNQKETGYALPPDLMLNVSDVEAVFLHRKREAVRRGRPRKLNLHAADYADVQRMARMISTGEAKTKHAAAQILALSVPERLRNAKVKSLLRSFGMVWHT